jgi:hypothetical protein
VLRTCTCLLYILLWLVALSLALDLPRLALALEVAYLPDEDRVDLQQGRDAVLVARVGDGRYGRWRDCLDGRRELRRLWLDLTHGLRLAVGREGAWGVLRVRRRREGGRVLRVVGWREGVRRAAAARGGVGCKLVVGGR